MTDTIRISEIFGPTIQGEGALIGQPTVFVRTGGCDYRCSWCDTLHAVDSSFRHTWKSMTTKEIFAQILKCSNNKPLMVSLSGGNPALAALGPLISLGKKQGFTYALETQGSMAKAWFADVDILTLSPKPPSSKMTPDWKIFDTCIEAAGDKPNIVLKIVVFDKDDYQFAKSVAQQYPQLKIYLQPGNHKVDGSADIKGLQTRYQWLIDQVMDDQWYEANVLPQLHVLTWGNQKGV